MKYRHLYALILVIIFCNCCKEPSKTDLPTDNIKLKTKNVLTSTVPKTITRTIKQDKKGNIGVAAFDGVFGMMEMPLPNLKVKRPRND